MMAVRGGDVDDVDVGIGNELSVRAVHFCRRRAVNLLNEGGGAVGGAGRGYGDDFVCDITDIACGGVGEEVLGECYDMFA